MAALSATEAPAFALWGDYRVQGSLRPGASRLEGDWLGPQALMLDDRAVNEHLARHPLWAGRFHCRLQAARVSRRQGVFAQRPDILYKRSHFRPASGSPPMPCDIVDVDKACTGWASRLGALTGWLGACAIEQAGRCIDNLPRTVANEYFVHEAGHGLGYDVDRKCADGYFHPGGIASPGLLALEELRADLQGLGVALHLLPTKEAVAVLVYQLMLRFGVHLDAVARGGPAPYGLVPYLLYRALCLVGVDLASCPAEELFDDQSAMVEAMVALSHHAQSLLTRPEADAAEALGSAMTSAAYLRCALSDASTLARFEATLQRAARTSCRTAATLNDAK